VLDQTAQAVALFLPPLPFAEAARFPFRKVLLADRAAREILAGTNEPIKSVAARCGFSRVARFCAQFKKTTQLSPGEYGKRQLYEAATR